MLFGMCIEKTIIWHSISARGDLRLCAEEKPLTIQLPINQEYAVYNFPFFVNERAEQKYRVNSNSRTYHGIADSHLDGYQYWYAIL